MVAAWIILFLPLVVVAKHSTPSHTNIESVTGAKRLREPAALHDIILFSWSVIVCTSNNYSYQSKLGTNATSDNSLVELWSLLLQLVFHCLQESTPQSSPKTFQKLVASATNFFHHFFNTTSVKPGDSTGVVITVDNFFWPYSWPPYSTTPPQPHKEEDKYLHHPQIYLPSDKIWSPRNKIYDRWIIIFAITVFFNNSITPLVPSKTGI